MRYRLVFDKKYKVRGRHTVNIGGSLVVFNDGVAFVSSKEIADMALRLRFISGVYEMPVEAPVVVETVLPEPVVESVVEEELVEEEEPVEEVVEEEIPVVEEVTREEESLAEMYERLGTWTAVANEMGVSTATLRKYREEAGLL